MTTEQPRTTASADHTSRLTADGLRRGISLWWYIVFLSSLAFEPMFASVAARAGVADGPSAGDWVLAVALIAVGAVLGLLATPVLIVNAASPPLFALVVDRWGWGTGQVVLVAACTASWLSIEMMSRWYRQGWRVP